MSDIEMHQSHQEAIVYAIWSLNFVPAVYPPASAIPTSAQSQLFA